MDENEELIQTAIFGKQVEAFFNSDIGRFLLAMADEEAEQAIKELKLAPAENSSLIREIQGRIWRAESIRGWLQSAVTQGVQALNIIDGREEEL